MQSRRTILILAMIFLVGGPVLFADAAIYKWKDENGKTYFTDDPTKVPETFRKKPFIKDHKFRKKFPIFRKKKAPDEAGETSHEKGLAETENKEGDKQEGLTDAERATAEAAVNFLEEDIPRYEKYYIGPANKSKLGALQKAVAAAAAQKQALWDQISTHDLPLFKEIAGFLITSIAADEKTQKIMPKKFNVRGQTQLLMNRLKSEAEQEKQFLENLTTALNAKPAKAETGGKFPPPVKKQEPPQSSPEISREKSLNKPGKATGGKEIKKSVKKEKQNLKQGLETYQKLLQGSEKARARHIKKIEELKNLSFKPKSWTTEESLEEMIEGLEEAVKKTDQEIRRYKEKIKEFSFQD